MPFHFLSRRSRKGASKCQKEHSKMKSLIKRSSGSRTKTRSRTFSFEVVAHAPIRPYWTPFLDEFHPLFVTIARKCDFRTNAAAHELLRDLAKRSIPSCLNVSCRGNAGEDPGCVTVAAIMEMIERFRAASGESLLVVRGDGPSLAADPSEGRFEHVSDMLSYLRTRLGGTDMCIAVGGYPEGHPSNWISGQRFSRNELQAAKENSILVEKMRLGAQVVICQATFDGNKYAAFAESVTTAARLDDADGDKHSGLVVVPSVLGPLPPALFARYAARMNIDTSMLSSFPQTQVADFSDTAAVERFHAALQDDYERLFHQILRPPVASSSSQGSSMHLHIFLPPQCRVKNVRSLVDAWLNTATSS